MKKKKHYWKLTTKDNHSIFAGRGIGKKLYYPIGKWVKAPHEDFPIFLFKYKISAKNAMNSRQELHKIKVKNIVELKHPSPLANWIGYNSTTVLLADEVMLLD